MQSLVDLDFDAELWLDASPCAGLAIGADASGSPAGGCGGLEANDLGIGCTIALAGRIFAFCAPAPF